MDSGQMATLCIEGRAFFIGDLHGERRQLSQLLGNVGFSPEKGDRLICVGDLIDRGPDSVACLDLLELPWFHSVLGNHEAMLMDALSGDTDCLNSWLRCGGQWFEALEDGERDAVVAKAQRLLPEVPLGLEIQLPALDARIGVVHAECPHDDWLSFRQACQRGLDSRQEFHCLWARDTLSRMGKGEYPTPVANIDALVLGHTPQQMFRSYGNRVWLDTGAGYPAGRLSLLSAEQILELVR
ncbi:metallophosphoesterase [Ferrimonas balearica]|uniref:metallophosphoesterase n=1 Tax=Ferrimonas balearica TaxID=44012 RepID=UPI0021BD7083|nr:metallophosphoesterase [Ferrimonas balearica]